MCCIFVGLLFALCWCVISGPAVLYHCCGTDCETWRSVKESYSDRGTCADRTCYHDSDCFHHSELNVYMLRPFVKSGRPMLYGGYFTPYLTKNSPLVFILNMTNFKTTHDMCFCTSACYSWLEENANKWFFNWLMVRKFTFWKFDHFIFLICQYPLFLCLNDVSQSVCQFFCFVCFKFSLQRVLFSIKLVTHHIYHLSVSDEVTKDIFERTLSNMFERTPRVLDTNQHEKFP